MEINCFPGRSILWQGESYIYFGGTSYLGIAQLPEFQNQLFKSIGQWGTSYGSSRNSNVKLSVYGAFEKDFSAFVGAESALAVSSGTLAGNMVLDYFVRNKYVIYHYPKSHPAIMVNQSLPLFVNESIHPALQSPTEEDVVIVLDGVLSSQVKPTSLDFLRAISKAKRITLVVDESHSLGIFGEEGEGLFKGINTAQLQRKIQVSSLAKAFGLAGGVIASSDYYFIESLKNDTTFISASGANPAYLDAYLKSKSLYKKQLSKLRENLRFLFEGITLSCAFNYHENYPVVYCEAPGFYDYMEAHKMIIANFKYPNYNGYLSRIVITANHTRSDLNRLKQVLLALN